MYKIYSVRHKGAEPPASVCLNMYEPELSHTTDVQPACPIMHRDSLQVPIRAAVEVFHGFHEFYALHHMTITKRHMDLGSVICL